LTIKLSGDYVVREWG